MSCPRLCNAGLRPEAAAEQWAEIVRRLRRLQRVRRIWASLGLLPEATQGGRQVIDRPPMSRPEGVAPPASGGRWFGRVFLDEDLVLTAAEVSLIPWAAHIGRRPGPPVLQDRGHGRRSQVGGRRCELCGGTYFSDRRVPPCSGGQQCPQAFGHRRGSVAWIDGRWVALDLLEEIVRRRNTGRTPSASSRAGGAGEVAAGTGQQQPPGTPLPDEPTPSEDEAWWRAEAGDHPRYTGHGTHTMPPTGETSDDEPRPRPWCSVDSLVFGGLESMTNAAGAPVTLENAGTGMQTEACEQRRQHLQERALLAALGPAEGMAERPAEVQAVDMKNETDVTRDWKGKESEKESVKDGSEPGGGKPGKGP